MASVQVQNLANTPDTTPLVDKDTGKITFNWNQWLTNVQIKINTINGVLVQIAGAGTVSGTFNLLSPLTTNGDILTYNASNNIRLGIGTAGQVLTVVGGLPAWTDPAASSPLTTKGDIYTYSTINTRLGVGTNGQVLSADSTKATGLSWVTPTAIPVTSVFGRTGAVAAVTNDYTFAQIGSTPTTLVGYGITDAEPAITAGTTAQYWRGDKTWQTLDKAAVGLGNVDNTSDVNKPVSTAQQNALNAKANNTAPTINTSVVVVGSSSNSVFFSLRNQITGGHGYSFYSSGGGPSALGTFGVYDETVGAPRLLIDTTGAIAPGVDNALSAGMAAKRYSVVYAGTGTINTSDAREKTAVSLMTSAELAAAADMARDIGTYQWLASVAEKGADVARMHAGLTVQQAIAIMQSHGLDPMRYGFICYDQWDETPEVMDPETGEVTQAYRPAGDRYSFRHDELLLFIARGFAARLDALESA